MNVPGFEAWTWLLVGLLLIGAEIATPGGLFLIFLGVAAVIVGVLRALGLVETMWVQFLAFAVLSMVSLALFRRPLMVRLRLSGTGRDDVDSVIGETAVALDDLPPDGRGTAQLRGSTWAAANTGVRPIRRGERCTVLRVDGLTLVIEPAPLPHAGPPAPKPPAVLTAEPRNHPGDTP